MFLYVQPSKILAGNIRQCFGKIAIFCWNRSHNRLAWFLVANLTQCLLETEKKSLSMTNMKMIDQVCYSLCDKFTTITSFCDNLLCKEGSARRYYRHNDTFTFSIYSITYNKYLIIYTALVLLHWQSRNQATTFTELWSVRVALYDIIDVNINVVIVDVVEICHMHMCSMNVII